ncbi:Uncharacterised protein [Klebsiella pneumoniae]|nr:Uncharacterised protein [Klebsiella pneumoniae]
MFDISVVFPYFPQLLIGVLSTLAVSLSAIVIGLILGWLICLGVKLSAASRALFLQNLCQFLSWNAVTGPVDINILCFANSRDHAFTIAGGGCGSLIKYRSLSRRDSSGWL